MAADEDKGVFPIGYGVPFSSMHFTRLPSLINAAEEKGINWVEINEFDAMIFQPVGSRVSGASIK